MGVGDVASAEPLFQRELAGAREGNDRRGQGDAYNMLGQAARCLGHYQEGAALLEQGIALFRELDDAGAVGAVLASLGDVARDAGDARSARRWYRQALRSEQNRADKRHVAFLLEEIAATAALDGDGRLALLNLEAASSLREEISAPQLPVEQYRAPDPRRHRTSVRLTRSPLGSAMVADTRVRSPTKERSREAHPWVARPSHSASAAEEQHGGTAQDRRCRAVLPLTV